MDRLNFVIDWYHKENERSTTLNDAISIPTGIATAVIVVYYFLITEFAFDFTEQPTGSIIFLLMLTISIVFWLGLVSYLFKSYNDWLTGYTYKAINFPTVLNNYYQDLSDYHNSLQVELGGERMNTDKEYETYLLHVVSDALEVNITNNDKKSYYIHVAKKALFACIIALIISLIPFLWNTMRKNKKYLQKEATKTIDLKQIQTNKIMTERPRPVPPSPPPLREIKEDRPPTRPTQPPKPRPESK